MVQHIGLSGETEKIEVTLLVMRLFSVLPGESRGCVRCVRTTAGSRFIGSKSEKRAMLLDNVSVGKPISYWSAILNVASEVLLTVD